jgi:hypothetical protein
MPDNTTTFTDNLRDQAHHQEASFARFGDIGVGNVKAALRLQTEMFDVLQDISRDWLTRATSEAEHAFALPNKLTTAKSVPDVWSAYHEWLNEWVSMCNEDSRRFIADSQRIVDKSVSCLSGASHGATT